MYKTLSCKLLIFFIILREFSLFCIWSILLAWNKQLWNKKCKISMFFSMDHPHTKNELSQRYFFCYIMFTRYTWHTHFSPHVNRGISCGVTQLRLPRIARYCQAQHTHSKHIYSTHARHAHRSYYCETMDSCLAICLTSNETIIESCDICETPLYS